MNGVNTAAFPAGLPAISVLKMAARQPIAPRQTGNVAGDAALLAAVQHPPRIGDARPLGELLPHVLARYGLGDQSTDRPAKSIELDVLA